MTVGLQRGAELPPEVKRVIRVGPSHVLKIEKSEKVISLKLNFLPEKVELMSKTKSRTFTSEVRLTVGYLKTEMCNNYILL